MKPYPTTETKFPHCVWKSRIFRLVKSRLAYQSFLILTHKKEKLFFSSAKMKSLFHFMHRQLGFHISQA